MTSKPDYYAILQVDPHAEPEVIQAAYRRLAAKYHPDVDPSPEALQRMKLLNAAYEVLSDPVKRRQHDMERERGSGRTPTVVRRPWWFFLLAVLALLLLLRFNVRLFMIVAPALLVLWLVTSGRLRK